MTKWQTQRRPRFWAVGLVPVVAVVLAAGGCSSKSKSDVETSAASSQVSSTTERQSTSGNVVTGGSPTVSTMAPMTKRPTMTTTSSGEPSEPPVPSSPPLSVEEFQTPSGNIACAIYEGGVRCDAREQSWNVPPDPDCEVDSGDALYLDSSGSGFSCHGDTILGMGTVLDYGSSTQVGNITCASEESGVTCSESTSGHWFMISRERYELG